jgi:hypothetical protein
MNKTRYSRSIFALLVCTLVFLLAACGQTTVKPPATGSPTSTGNPSTTPLPGTTPTVAPTVTTAPVPPTQTDCPAANTARSAVMRPLALGSHQNLVYIYNEVPQNTSTAFGTCVATT